MKLFISAVFLVFSSAAMAKICKDFGPQTPRDITSKSGKNPVTFTMAPAKEKLNLCNIHFHKGAENKGPEFSLAGKNVNKDGFLCNSSKTLSAEKLKATSGKVCKNLSPGDTVEIHWVYSSCQVKPGAGLGSCLSDSCANPQLRVETQVFVLTNDAKGDNFMKYSKLTKKGGLHQVTAKPKMKNPVAFLGSTTGPKYSQKTCSPLQVTWNVSSSCQELDINSLGKWCNKNEFSEDHAHGVRPLVTDLRLLSPIK